MFLITVIYKMSRDTVSWDKVGFGCGILRKFGSERVTRKSGRKGSIHAFLIYEVAGIPLTLLHI